MIERKLAFYKYFSYLFLWFLEHYFSKKKFLIVYLKLGKILNDYNFEYYCIIKTFPFKTNFRLSRYDFRFSKYRRVNEW